MTRAMFVAIAAVGIATSRIGKIFFVTVVLAVLALATMYAVASSEMSCELGYHCFR